LPDEYGWYQTNSDGWSHRTGLLRPSVGGLFDIHGNLSEWTHDWYKKGSYRVYRGGSWDDDAADCRAAGRSYGPPTNRADRSGFRVALSSSSQAQVPAEPELGDEEASGAEADR
jgi:formylglycine-generating enzyme required for sulfatase activity